MKNILLQGDSITDAGRANNDDPNSAGAGYAMLLKAHLMMEDPDCVVYNCGISGHRVVDLYARWKKHCLNLEPDVLSIMVGVNDVWHEYGWQNGVEADRYENIYRLMLKETVEKLPNIKVILMAPYLIEGPVGHQFECGFETFYNEIKLRQDVVKKLADEFGFAFLDTQKVFDDAIAKGVPASHWSGDGVHPTPAGHELIKRAWLEIYSTL